MKKGTILKTAFDEYQIVELIGGGGAGEVFQIYNSKNERLAVKLLRPGLPLEKRNRFINEIVFCQKGVHPGIIKIIDHGIFFDKKGDRPFYVMPFYDCTLRKIINEESNSKKKFDMFGNILQSIESAHLLKCWHRDLKPENILINKSNDSLVIADFGIAHFEENDLIASVETLSSERLANFQYASPEQRKKGGIVDQRSDIFSLGLMLNELFTKAVPHGTGFKKIAEVENQFSFLDDIVEKMIANNPTDRFQSIQELKNEINSQNNIYVAQQKLDAIDKIVVSEFETTHPLIKLPVKINEADYQEGKLILTLNHEIPDDWKSFFYKEGATSWTSKHNPGMVEFKGNKVYLKTPMDFAVEGKWNVKEWIEETNRKFPSYIKQKKMKEIEENNQLQAEIRENEKKRIELLKKLKT